jgi:hypothetical protein
MRLLRLIGSALFLIVIIFAFQTTPTSREYMTQLWSLSSLHYSEFDRKVRSRIASSSDVTLELIEGGGAALSAPRASQRGGRFAQPIRVTLEPTAAGETIRYTLDGSIPTRRSSAYQRPLVVDSTLVLRFRGFRSGFLPSPTVTHTYVVGLDVSVPVISLTLDPATLWNRYSGIYEHPYEKGSKWERDGHLEFFPTLGEALFATDGKVRIHGGSSRAKPKKSLRFIFPIPASGSTDAGLFTAPGSGSHRTVVLRAGGSNTTQHRIRDELFATVYQEVGGYVASFQPFMLLLNGQLWGLYDLREHLGSDYLERHFGPGAYDLVEDFGISGGVLAGDRKAFDEMLAYFDATDFRSDAAFDSAARLIDVDAFTDYWIANIYAANLDWPHNNSFAFRRRTGPDLRWRWISWDADATFDFMGQGLHHDTLAWSVRDQLRHDLRFNNHKGNRDHPRNLIATLIARRLLQNERYRRKFIARLGTLLETEFRPERMEQALQRVIVPVSKDLRYDWERWSLTPESYQTNLTQIRTFFHRRPAVMTEHVRRYFNLND